MTTYNYYLTSIMMPRVIFANRELFFANILPSPENMKKFFGELNQKIVNQGGENVEKLPKEWKIDVNVAAIGEDRLFIFAFHGEMQHMDNHFVAISTKKGKERYFTLEQGISQNQEPIFVLGEWIVSVEDSKITNVAHSNFGKLEDCEMKTFVNKVVEIITK